MYSLPFSAKRGLDQVGGIVVALVLIVTIGYLVLPILMAIIMSFDARGFMGPFPPTHLSLRWYDRLFSDPRYLVGLRVSLIVSVSATLMSTALGVAVAVVLDRQHVVGKEALSAFFLSPLIVPGVVVGFALLMFLAMLGLYDGLLRLLCGHVLISIPYIIRTTLAGLVGINRNLSEAALTLGATERQAFWDITFPLAKTGIVAGAILAFAFSFDDVSMSIFLADTHSYTLPIALLSSMRANFDLTTAAAAVLLVGFTIALVYVLDRAVGVDRVFGAGIYGR
jgi:putative spermidine/putrescine transport system permease protein